MVDQLDNVVITLGAKGLWILNISLAVVMFGVALGVSFNDFRNLFRQPKLLLLGIFSQFFLLPFITYVFILLIQPAPSIALGMIMVASCPGGNISNFLTHLANGNVAFSVSLTAFATFLAMFMTPFNFQFYGSLYGPTSSILKTIEINPFDLFKLIILILGVPLILGMMLRYKNEQMALKLSKILKPLSILVFVSIVVVAFAQNLDVFFEYISQVFLIGVFHNILALGSGLLLAVVFGLSAQNKKTLTIETGIQNSGLGLMLIFTFFDGLGGMALIAAFWGIWHIISGLSLALFWSKTTTKTALV
jgi:BASS family bile acid:Na+ symporter